jgi:hypothetical protein
VLTLCEVSAGADLVARPVKKLYVATAWLASNTRKPQITQITQIKDKKK